MALGRRPCPGIRSNALDPLRQARIATLKVGGIRPVRLAAKHDWVGEHRSDIRCLDRPMARHAPSAQASAAMVSIGLTAVPGAQAVARLYTVAAT